jgi:creatinine amidohydrolase
MENFPWTRIAGVVLPEGSKPQVDYARLQVSNPAQVRELVGDGNYHGLYARNDQDMMRLWDVAVEETRQLLESGWG